MKTPKPLLLLWLLLLQQLAPAQVQWYQNQDGNNPPPYGTYAAAVQPFNGNSFIACYQWQVNNDEYTWKISKTQTNGAEVRSFFVTGIMANAEIRVKKGQFVYVLKRNYPYGQNPEYIVYRLNGNLDIAAERTISFPNDFNITSLNAFEIDGDGNVYLAGDGQYSVGPGSGYASFVLKTNKNLVTTWSRMDSVQTSYTRLHIDYQQKVTLIADYYSTYPAIQVIRINRQGTQAVTTTVVPDAARYSLSSMLDKNNHLLVFGGKMMNDTTQAAYFCRVSGATGNIVYRKTLYIAPSSQLNDIKIDNYGKVFSLATLYYPGEIQTKISRINPVNGRMMWNRSVSFNADSCQFTRLVVSEGDRFFAVGEKKCGSYFAKGFALRVKKSGQLEGNMPSPDSVAWQRYHSLVDGLIDNNQQLIGIGNTNDYDTVNHTSSYYRAFAVRFGDNGCNNNSAKEEIPEISQPDTKPEAPAPQIRLFPNPVQDQLTVNNLDPAVYSRLTIFTMQGTMVLQQKISTVQASIDVSGLANGVYLLSLGSSATGKDKIIRFVINR